MSDAITIEKPAPVQDAIIAEVSDAANLPAIFESARRDMTPELMDSLKLDALIVSQSLNAPVGFQGQPEKCLSIAYQSRLWGLDPVAVASKCYLVPVRGGGERLAYEAQLVAALINTKAPLRDRMNIEFFGTTNQRYCVVSGVTLAGQKLVYASPIIGQIQPKQSQLWTTDPDQQLSYHSQRAFARRYFPEIMLGIYTPDELRTVQITDLTPRVDPYADEGGELEHVEVTVEPEPSGGKDWKAPQRQAAPPQDEAPRQPRTTNPSQEKIDASDREWCETMRARIVLLTDPKDVTENGASLKGDPRFKRLAAAHKADAQRILKSIANRIDELNAG